jgi:hypothetical protein
VLGVIWLVIALGAAGLGWQRSNRILIAVGVLMLAVAAWNATVHLRSRGI